MCARLKAVQEKPSAAAWCWLMVSKFLEQIGTMCPVDIWVKDLRISAILAQCFKVGLV